MTWYNQLVSIEEVNYAIGKILAVERYIKLADLMSRLSLDFDKRKDHAAVYVRIVETRRIFDNAWNGSYLTSQQFQRDFAFWKRESKSRLTYWKQLDYGLYRDLASMNLSESDIERIFILSKVFESFLKWMNSRGFWLLISGNTHSLYRQPTLQEYVRLQRHNIAHWLLMTRNAEIREAQYMGVLVNEKSR